MRCNFRALPLIHEKETVIVGLPDTIWFPEDGFLSLPDHLLSFLVFPVDRPELFDAVLSDRNGRVSEIQVKQNNPGSSWVWGAFKMPGSVMHKLYCLWQRRGRTDEYIGTLVNAYLAEGGEAAAVCAGEVYVDVGTLNGYREAMRVLNEKGNNNGAIALEPANNAAMLISRSV